MANVRIINPSYKNDNALIAFINNLPDSFEDKGDLLWNGRNKIKTFELTTKDTEGNTEKMVVKRFKKPNLIQKLGYIFRSHKARKAFENGMEMKHRDIDTPEPIAFVEKRKGLFLTDAYYICQELKDNTEIIKAFEKEEWDKNIAKALAHFFAKLHKRGILHHDLNNTNILFTKKDKDYHFTLIDINRVTFYNSIEDIPMRMRIENMTRFSGRYDLFLFIAKEYATACGISNPEQWAEQAICQKKEHDRNWKMRKTITHPLRALSKRS